MLFHYYYCYFVFVLLIIIFRWESYRLGFFLVKEKNYLSNRKRKFKWIILNGNILIVKYKWFTNFYFLFLWIYFSFFMINPFLCLFLFLFFICLFFSCVICDNKKNWYPKYPIGVSCIYVYTIHHLYPRLLPFLHHFPTIYHILRSVEFSVLCCYPPISYLFFFASTLYSFTPFYSSLFSLCSESENIKLYESKGFMGEISTNPSYHYHIIIIITIVSSFYQ